MNCRELSGRAFLGFVLGLALCAPAAAVLGLALCAPAAASEPDLEEVAAERQSFELRRDRLRRQGSVELEGLARICHLEERQRVVLEVAMRGVVERLLEGQNQPPAPNDPFGEGWMGGEIRFERSDLLEHELWRETLREVLTGGQLAALEMERRSLERQQRDASIELACGVLQMELRLSEAQREQMGGLLRRSLSESFRLPSMEVGIYTQWLDRDEVGKILTEKQFAYWLDLWRRQRDEEDPFLNR